MCSEGGCRSLKVTARYCMHFHLSHHCPDCLLQGNAFVHSFQVTRPLHLQSAVTIHGTHSTTVDNNVMWDSK